MEETVKLNCETRSITDLYKWIEASNGNQIMVTTHDTGKEYSRSMGDLKCMNFMPFLWFNFISYEIWYDIKAMHR